MVNENDKKEIEVFTKEEIKRLVQHKRSFNERISLFLVVRDNLIINYENDNIAQIIETDKKVHILLSEIEKYIEK